MSLSYFSPQKVSCQFGSYLQYHTFSNASASTTALIASTSVEEYDNLRIRLINISTTIRPHNLRKPPADLDRLYFQPLLFRLGCVVTPVHTHGEESSAMLPYIVHSGIVAFRRIYLTGYRSR